MLKEVQKMQKLSTENIEKLIDAVREHPSLYDKRDKRYKKTDLNDTIWKKIAQDLQLDGKLKFILSSVACVYIFKLYQNVFINFRKDLQSSMEVAA